MDASVGRAQNTEGNGVAWPITYDLFFICTILNRENNKVKVCQYCAMEVGVCITLINLAGDLWRIRSNLGDASVSAEKHDN